MTGTGECKEFMKAYLDCMKTAKSKSTDCRHLSKKYLGCRMDKCASLSASCGGCGSGADVGCGRGLMERVEWEDLGFTEGVDATAKAKHPMPPVQGAGKQ